MANVEEFIRAAKLDNDQVQQLLQSYQGTVKQLSASIGEWYDLSDIESLEGLEGQYLWTEDVQHGTGLMELKFNPGEVGSAGTYTLERTAAPREQGDFHCVAMNPFIGYPSITLCPETGPSRLCVIILMKKEASGCISNMIFGKVAPNGLAVPTGCAVRKQPEPRM